MGQQPDGQAKEAAPTAAGLAYACRYWLDIRDVLSSETGDVGHQVPLPMRHLADAVRTGADVRGPLEALHAALRDAGDPRGVWGAARAAVLTGVNRDVPFEPVYSCPRGLCAGHIVDAAVSISFTCALTGQPLRKAAL